MSDDTSLPEIPPETFCGTGSSTKTGMPTESRSASEKAAEAESNYEKKLSLPEVTPVTWTAKDRKKPKAISELKRSMPCSKTKVPWQNDNFLLAFAHGPRWSLRARFVVCPN